MKILLVDDEPNVLEALEANLMFDYDVVTAGGGAQGLERMNADGPFGVVISDMRMPEMNGARFLAEVKRRHPDTTRVLLTGYSEVDAAISAINDGSVFRFLTKPCPPDVLVETVEQGLEQHRLRLAERELLEGTVRGAVGLLTDVLKGELGFRGFLVSDWEAINQVHPDLYTAICLSINAGLDLNMVPYRWQEFMQLLAKAVNAGDVPMTRIFLIRSPRPD